MDELILQGKKYISSKRAADVSKYAKDYIGQLARAGKINATRVGRAWFIEEATLLKHIGESSSQGFSELQPARAMAPDRATMARLYTPFTMPNTWGRVNYSADDGPILPPISEKDELSDTGISKNTAENIVIPVRSALSAVPAKFLVVQDEAMSGVRPRQSTGSRKAVLKKERGPGPRSTRERSSGKWGRIVTVAAGAAVIIAAAGVFWAQLSGGDPNIVSKASDLGAASALSESAYNPIEIVISSIVLGFENVRAFAVELGQSAIEFTSTSLVFIRDMLSFRRDI